MALILVTGASTGLGLATARTLVDRGHEVVLHARRVERVEDPELVERVHAVVTADLADLGATMRLADEVNAIGRLDAVIHNAGVMQGGHVMATNLLAPYVLTASLTAPGRTLFLSSSMHRSGSTDLDRVDFTGAAGTQSYSDSKLYVTALAMALADRPSSGMVHAVDPGWVPTRMGGPRAPDDFEQGHETQEWLATAPETEIDPRTGGYWHHRATQDPHPVTRDRSFQRDLLDRLAAGTGLGLA